MSKKQQVQINRMIEALEMIADMPFVDPALNLTVGQVAAQYEEARETAQMAVAQYERSEMEPEQASNTNAALEAEYCALRREASRGRTLASYILGRTEDLHNAPDVNAALTAIREKCNEEVGHASF